MSQSQESIQQKFRDFWKVVVEALKDSPGVLGYDLVNAAWQKSPAAGEPVEPVKTRDYKVQCGRKSGEDWKTKLNSLSDASLK